LRTSSQRACASSVVIASVLDGVKPCALAKRAAPSPAYST
jgi:hypothetical protein